MSAKRSRASLTLHQIGSLAARSLSMSSCISTARVACEVVDKPEDALRRRTVRVSDRLEAKCRLTAFPRGAEVPLELEHIAQGRFQACLLDGVCVLDRRFVILPCIH